MQYLLLPLFSHLCHYFRVVRMLILKMFFKTPTPMRDELDLIMVIPCLMPRWPIHSISGGAVPFFVCSKLSFFCILNYVWSWVHFIIVICPLWQIAIGLGSQTQLLMADLWVINTVVTYIWFNCPLKYLHREYTTIWHWDKAMSIEWHGEQYCKQLKRKAQKKSHFQKAWKNFANKNIYMK